MASSVWRAGRQALQLCSGALLGPRPRPPRCALPSSQRVEEGRTYYDFEFTAKSKTYTRHAAGSVTVGNGAPGGQRGGTCLPALRARSHHRPPTPPLNPAPRQASFTR